MLEKARAIEAQLVAWRRAFHHHPELGFQEVHTAARAAAILEEMGWRVRTGVGKTGLVAEMGAGKPIIAIRADMDALPILEASEAPYASENPGIMHACGHDAHTAMVLGVAALLRKEEFSGAMRLFIQPSEEANDREGFSGAPRMIQDGAMQDVDRVIALHVDPATPVGSIRLSSGPSSGGVDSFFATIYGKGGHGASPHTVVDPIYITGHVLLALHGIVSRRLDPFAPAVISIGSLHGGQAENVIPDRVELAGTIRFLEKDVQAQIHTEVERALSIARLMGGDYELEIQTGTPPMINDPGVVQVMSQAAGDLLGAEHVLPPKDGLGAEDFGCFSEIAPGAMFSLGCRIEGDERHLHNPRFDIDEGCLPVGAAILAETALRLSKQLAQI
jgi:amidohydrolase